MPAPSASRRHRRPLGEVGGRRRRDPGRARPRPGRRGAGPPHRLGRTRRRAARPRPRTAAGPAPALSETYTESTDDWRTLEETRARPSHRWASPWSAPATGAPTWSATSAARPSGTCEGSATSTWAGPRRSSVPRSVDGHRQRSSEVLATATLDAVAIATPARTHRGVALQALARRQARAGREAAGRHVAAGRRWSTLADAAGPGPDVRPHLLLHAGGAEDPRAGRRAASWATCTTSTRCGSTSAWSSPTSTCFWDLAPHDLSILDFILPGGLRHRRRRRPRAPTRSAPGAACVGYLTLPLPERRARPRARQLAQPDQDPPDGHRRLPPHAGLGRPEPAAAPQRLRPGRRPGAARRSGGARAPRRWSPTASATLVAGAARARGAGRDGRRVRRRDPRGPPAAHRRRRRRCGCSSVLERGLGEPGRRRQRWCRPARA